MGRFVFVAAFLMSLQLIPVAANASVTSDVFAAYQAASEAGDYREARDASRRAYNAARDASGEMSSQALQFAAVHASVLNDLLAFREAADFLSRYIEVPNTEFADQQVLPYQIYLQMGRALLSLRETDEAHELFLMALNAAIDHHGTASVEAGLAHLELARPGWSNSTTMTDPAQLRMIGTGQSALAGSIDSLESAERIFSNHPDRRIERALLKVMRAGNFMANDDRDGAEPILLSAIADLEDIGYMDDFVLTLYINWIEMHYGEWSITRIQNGLNHAIDLARTRVEGDALPVVRNIRYRHPRARSFTYSGVITVEYRVNEEGLIRRTRVTDSTEPGVWDEGIRAMVRGWIYIPAQERGEPVARDGLTTQFQLDLEPR